MTLNPRIDVVPIAVNADGDALVGGTRVPLDTVIAEFKEGATAEEIVQHYTSLDLADVYLVIAYYLRAQGEVEQYLAERAQHADQVRQENEARFDPTGVRARLLARKRKQD